MNLSIDVTWAMVYELEGGIYLKQRELLFHLSCYKFSNITIMSYESSNYWFFDHLLSFSDALTGLGSLQSQYNREDCRRRDL